MRLIPPVPLMLAAAGLIPFLWGSATEFVPGLNEMALAWLGPRFLGPYLQVFYGQLILSFMSGVLWGFATQDRAADAWTGYALSVVPCLWVFFFTGDGVASTAMYLSAGFLAVLGLDWHFARRGLTPDWWMALRVPVTAVVLASYLPLWL
jgi:hypothetical protein